MASCSDLLPVTCYLYCERFIRTQLKPWPGKPFSASSLTQLSYAACGLVLAIERSGSFRAPISQASAQMLNIPSKQQLGRRIPSAHTRPPPRTSLLKRTPKFFSVSALKLHNCRYTKKGDSKNCFSKAIPNSDSVFF